jgi:hypothetical protein
MASEGALLGNVIKVHACVSWQCEMWRVLWLQKVTALLRAVAGGKRVKDKEAEER